MIISMFPAGISGSGSGGEEIIAGWNYTGAAEYINDGDGNWRIKFLESGILTLARDADVDIFAVGGGAGGGVGNGFEAHETDGTVYEGAEGGYGGAGGYTATVRDVRLTGGTAYPIEIGAGGEAQRHEYKNGRYVETDPSGGTTSMGELISAQGGGMYGNGGSGGAGRRSAVDGTTKYDWDGGRGGSDGSAGGGRSPGGGQGTTTREFGETNGDLYAGGGGSGGYAGGNGGGGRGALTDNDGIVDARDVTATNGAANTGGGGGSGDMAPAGYILPGGNGGSGILIIRNARG